MVKPIKELRKICQDRGKGESWLMRHIYRKVSIYITWLFLHTPISANQVTFLDTIIGLVAIVFFAIGGRWYSLIGILILHFYSVLDCVDGEIARYRNASSSTGIFLDLMGHVLLHAFFFISISFGIYRIHHQWQIFIFGFVATIALLLYDCMEGMRLRALTMFDKVTGSNSGKGVGVAERISWRVRIKGTLLYICTFHGIREMTLLAVLINRIEFALYFYAVILPLRWVAFMFRTVSKMKKMVSEKT